MAMFENLGFCPSNSFTRYEMEMGDKVPMFWKRTQQLLGDRILYMVYTPAGNHYNGWCHVVECLVGATATLGIEVATKLETLIPECEYAETGRKILVTDVIHPFQIPGIGQKADGHFFGADDTFIREDERYVAVVKEEGEDVHLYFFKKAIAEVAE